MPSERKKYVNSGQIKAARALLDWSQEDLAIKTGLSTATIRKVESGGISPRGSTMEAFAEAFESVGIEFTPPNGVNLRDNEVTIIEGDDVNLRLLDDVYTSLRKGGELLFWNADNTVADEEVVASELHLRNNGVKFRMLIEEGDTYMRYPVEEYRWLPKKFFKNHIEVVYGNKVALSIEQASSTRALNKIVIIESAALAESMRNNFNFMWENCRPPAFTTAPKTYA